MSFDPVVSAKVYRSGLELTFHDPEAFFDFPSPFVDPDDCGCIIFKVSTYGIESIERFFF